MLVRTELDALPVEEKTGVPYASQVKMKNDAGLDVSVMHACGHDIHMTSFLGTAKMLTELKNRWSGTLVMLGQPAEETGDGANAMLRDNLYANFRNLISRSRCTTNRSSKPARSATRPVMRWRVRRRSTSKSEASVVTDRRLKILKIRSSWRRSLCWRCKRL